MKKWLSIFLSSMERRERLVHTPAYDGHLEGGRNEDMQPVGTDQRYMTAERIRRLRCRVLPDRSAATQQVPASEEEGDEGSSRRSQRDDAKMGKGPEKGILPPATEFKFTPHVTNG